MSVYWSEQMRIAMQCTKAAHNQCRMMMFLPWMRWLPELAKTDKA